MHVVPGGVCLNGAGGVCDGEVGVPVGAGVSVAAECVMLAVPLKLDLFGGGEVQRLVAVVGLAEG